MKDYLKKLSKKDKIIYSTFTILTIIILLINFIYPNSYSFTSISFLANFFLIIIVREVLKLLKVKFTKKELIGMTIIIILMYLFYIISILNRQFLYFFDYACYYNIGLASKEHFAISLLDGIRYFISSTWSGEYGNFLSFFPEIIFRFTNQTINSYILSYILAYTPYLIITLGILLKKLSEKLQVKKETLFFNLALLTTVLFPIFHATAIYGQPDFFGLAFIFLIISLTINYDFKKLEVLRLILLLLITFMLTISRRWYIYWIVSYYFCYLIGIIILNFKDKKSLKAIFKNICLYAIIVIIFFILTLFPMLKNILFGSIGNYSAFYLDGGFKTEMTSQLSHLGYLMLILMLMGAIYGLVSKKYRLLTILNVIDYFLMIFLFTRIQNMGLHHSPILLPNYLYFLYLCFIYFINTKESYDIRCCLVIFSIIIVNFLNGLLSNTTDNLFTKINLTVPSEENYPQYVEVATWLEEHINENEIAYMICHNRKYNPDKFRNIFMPDKTISNYLAYGSAIIGSHKFPYGLFDAKYILTIDPFESVSIEYKYNDVFKELVENNKFKLIEQFDMNDGFNILIYERTTKVDEEEISLYLDALNEESKLYPDLYKNVIENYEIKD